MHILRPPAGCGGVTPARPRGPARAARGAAMGRRARTPQVSRVPPCGEEIANNFTFALYAALRVKPEAAVPQ